AGQYDPIARVGIVVSNGGVEEDLGFLAEIVASREDVVVFCLHSIRLSQFEESVGEEDCRRADWQRTAPGSGSADNECDVGKRSIRVGESGDGSREHHRAADKL
ncbi:hypothetical protein PMAYCL1PPCAC_16425, partial [Pristionchus mayeri]